jgi:tetratricopeptide (TPR) repeat protein
MSLPSQNQIDSLVKIYRSGSFKEAKKIARIISKNYPKFAMAWAILGTIALKEEKLDEALNYLITATQLDPNNLNHHNNKGLVLMKLNRLEESKQAFEQAINLNTKDAGFYNNYASVLRSLNIIDGAIINHKKAIEINPNYVEAIHNLGITYTKINQYKAALRYFYAALKLSSNPENKFALILDTAIAEFQLNLRERSQERFEYILKNDPKRYIKAISYVIRIEAYNEDPTKSGEVFNELLKYKYPSVAEFNEIINAYSEVKSYKKLKQIYNLGIKQYPKSSALLTTMYTANLNMDNYHDAYNNILDAEEYASDSLTKLRIQIIIANYLRNYDQEKSEEQLIKIINAGNDFSQLEKGSQFICFINLAILKYLKMDYIETDKCIKKSEDMGLSYFLSDRKNYLLDTELFIINTFKNLLSENLKALQKENKSKDRQNFEKLYVIGESHSLASHDLEIEIKGKKYLSQAKFIIGVKQYHLGRNEDSLFKYMFKEYFNSIPKESTVLLAIGEIDIREDGIIKAFKKKNDGSTLEDLINLTIDNYFNFIDTINLDFNNHIIMQGTSCRHETDSNTIIEATTIFNDKFREEASKRGYGFLDLHKMTNNGKNITTMEFTYEGMHITRQGMQNAWKHFYIS